MASTLLKLFLYFAVYKSYNWLRQTKANNAPNVGSNKSEFNNQMTIKCSAREYDTADRGELILKRYLELYLTA